MENDHDLESHLAKNNQAIDALAIEMEAHQREIQAFLSELGVTQEQLTTFLSNPDHFTEENWEVVQREKATLNHKLLRELLQVANPKQLQKKYEERRVQPHWLFVR